MRTIKHFEKTESSEEKSKLADPSFSASCRDCGYVDKDVSRIEFKRRSAPRCRCCGGMLDANEQVRCSLKKR